MTFVFSCACFLSLDEYHDSNIRFIEKHMPSTILIILHVLPQLIFKIVLFTGTIIILVNKQRKSGLEDLNNLPKIN